MTQPRMRAGDSDRQAAVDRLTTHFTDGRLDPNEYDDRVGKAYAAVFADQFGELFVDLPPEAPRGRGGSGPGTAGGAGPWAGPFAGAGPAGGRPGWGPRGDGPAWAQRGHHGPPRIFAVLALLAVVFSIGAIAHGFFPIPLLWLGIAMIFMARRGGGPRRRFVDSGGYGRRR